VAKRQPPDANIVWVTREGGDWPNYSIM